MSTTDTVIDPRQIGGIYETAGWGIYRVVYIWPTGDFSVIWQGESQAGMYALLPWHPDRDTVVSLPFTTADQEAVDNLKAALERLDKLPDAGERVAGKLDLVFDAMEARLIDAGPEAGQVITGEEEVDQEGLAIESWFAAALAADQRAKTATDSEADLTPAEDAALDKILAEGNAALLSDIKRLIPPDAVKANLAAVLATTVTDSEALRPRVVDAHQEAALRILAHQTDATDSEAPAETLTGQVGTGKAIHEIKLDDVTRLGDAQAGDAVTSWCGKSGLLSKPGATITCKRCQRH